MSHIPPYLNASTCENATPSGGSGTNNNHENISSNNRQSLVQSFNTINMQPAKHPFVSSGTPDPSSSSPVAQASPAKLPPLSASFTPARASSSVQPPAKTSYVGEFEQLTEQMQATIMATIHSAIPAQEPTSELPPAPSIPAPSANALRDEELRRQYESDMRDVRRIRQTWFITDKNLLGQPPKVKEDGYPPIAAFESELGKRPISFRFDKILRHGGFSKLDEIWQARNRHTACQTVIPPHLQLDVYTLACNDDMAWLDTMLR